MTKQAKPMNEKKAQLIKLSATLKLAMELGQIEANGINEAILEVYQAQHGATTFNTYKGWLKEGKQVKKGSKAVTVWGAPRKGTKQNEANAEIGTEATESKYKFWPMAYLFTADQVDDK